MLINEPISVGPPGFRLWFSISFTIPSSVEKLTIPLILFILTTVFSVFQVMGLTFD
jgi:hypothetical protein